MTPEKWENPGKPPEPKLTENERLFTHWAGHAAEAEAASKEALAKSGEHFAADRLEEAKIWKEVGKWLAERGKQHRKTQQEFR